MALENDMLKFFGCIKCNKDALQRWAGKAPINVRFFDQGIVDFNTRIELAKQALAAGLFIEINVEQTTVQQTTDAVINEQDATVINELESDPTIIEPSNAELPVSEPITQLPAGIAQIDALLTQQQQEFQQTGVISTQEFQVLPTGGKGIDDILDRPQTAEGLAPLLLLALVAFAG